MSTTNTESTRYYSHKQESKIAKDLGGRLSANSGAAFWSGGDVRLNNCLLECKTCMEDKKSFSIKKDWLNKIQEEALFANKEYYGLAFNFGPGQDNYFIIPQWMFQLLMEKIDKD